MAILVKAKYAWGFGDLLISVTAIRLHFLTLAPTSDLLKHVISEICYIMACCHFPCGPRTSMTSSLLSFLPALLVIYNMMEAPLFLGLLSHV